MTAKHNLIRLLSRSILGLTGLIFTVAPVAAQAGVWGIPETSTLTTVTLGVPQTPQVELVESTTDSVEVRWGSDVRTILADFSVDTVSEIGSDVSTQTTYVVTVTDNAADSTAEALYDGEISATSVRVDHLLENHGYTVAVVAQRYGMSSDAGTLVVRTAPAAPETLAATTIVQEPFHDVLTNEPINGFGESASTKYIARLYWKEPKGKIRSYRVEVFSKGSDTPLQILTTTKHRVNVKGLELGKKYEYQVTALFNDAYASAVSNRITFQLRKHSPA